MSNWTRASLSIRRGKRPSRRAMARSSNRRGGVDADPGGHLDQARRRHVGVTLMSLRHVLVYRDMAATLGAAHVAGDARVILEDLDSPIGEPDVHPTTDQSVRHRVKGLVDFDMIIGVDLRRFPFGVFERLARQR